MSNSLQPTFAVDTDGFESALIAYTGGHPPAKGTSEYSIALHFWCLGWLHGRGLCCGMLATDYLKPPNYGHFGWTTPLLDDEIKRSERKGGV